jgi:lipoprotein-releasing system ATP-binding protein
MLQAQNIVRNYGSLQVLRGVNLDVAESEIVAITGASGAGKTTLLQIIGTLDNADSGKIVLAGTDITALKGNKLSSFRNQKIGFVFQFHNLLPEFSALENVMIPGMIAGKSTTILKQEATELLTLLGLADRLNHAPATMSGGEQQRVAVARALINRPAVILADEPSGNLDSANAKALHELFFTLRKERGHTFIIVTHNEQLASMADRQIRMKDGLILES